VATYSFSQLEQLWISAGGPRALAPVMAAIALAESGGNPAAYNPSGASGLWQILGAVNPKDQGSLFNPQVNAHEAVLKYKSQGLGAWVTYTSGAYKKFLPKGYVAPTSAGIPASAGKSEPAASDIQLTSFNPADVLDPFQAVVDAAQSAGQAIANLVTHPGSVAEGVSTFAKDFNALASVLNAFFTDLLWLFNPTHWVRIFCFLFGTGTLSVGMWALIRTGTGKSGDITLALGILFTIAGGALLFIAFHNVPDDVKNLQELLGWIAAEIGGQTTTQANATSDAQIA